MFVIHKEPFLQTYLILPFLSFSFFPLFHKVARYLPSVKSASPYFTVSATAVVRFDYDSQSHPHYPPLPEICFQSRLGKPLCVLFSYTSFPRINLFLSALKWKFVSHPNHSIIASYIYIVRHIWYKASLAPRLELHGVHFRPSAFWKNVFIIFIL